jgi:hypothetical protein
MTTPNSYDPDFVKVAGFGQTTGNPEPSTFIESIAINKDCSVYQDCYVGGKLTVTGAIFASGDINGKGSLNINGQGNFAGVVSAAGFRYGGRSFFGSNQFVVEAPATFLNTLTTATAPSTFNGLIDAAKGIAADALAVAPIPFPNPFNLDDSLSPYYRPVNADGDYIRTPIEFVPCYLSRLPADAIVLAYIPSLNPLPN